MQSPEVESRTQGSRPSTTKSEAKARTALPRTDPLEDKDTGDKCSQQKSLEKIFSGDLKKKTIFKNIFQAIYKILTIQEIVLSLSRGQGNFRELEARGQKLPNMSSRTPPLVIPSLHIVPCSLASYSSGNERNFRSLLRVYGCCHLPSKHGVGFALISLKCKRQTKTGVNPFSKFFVYLDGESNHGCSAPSSDMLGYNFNRNIQKNLMRFRNKTDAVCDRLLTNLAFLERIEKDSDFWGKYMRVRYEDFILNPIGFTLKIYEFIGLNMTLEIKDWLDTAFSVTNKDELAKKSTQGLRRNVKSVMNNWRNDLSFEAVQEIQSKCGRILKILDYKIFRNNQDFKDLSTLYFTPNWSP